MKGPWQFWGPRQEIVPVTITSSGQLQKSFENERGLIDFSAQSVYSNISFNTRGETSPGTHTPDIFRDYVRHPECGQAWNSLHSRKTVEGRKPMLLFFHHHLHNGNPADHFFSFSNDVSRKTYGESLAAICNIPASWRQPTVAATETTSGVTVDGFPVATYIGSHTDNVDIVVDGFWVDHPDHELDLNTSQSITYRRLPEKINHVGLSCGLKRAVFDMEATTPFNLAAARRIDRWTEINKANKSAFWKDYRFVLEKAPVSKVIVNQISHGFNIMIARLSACHAHHPFLRCNGLSTSQRQSGKRSFKSKLRRKIRSRHHLTSKLSRTDHQQSSAWSISRAPASISRSVSIQPHLFAELEPVFFLLHPILALAHSLTEVSQQATAL
ncbi:hypothetical protein ONS95_003667 [Cadophora gregata]|uniref:uncharacterized protein n=1 Tax=Cadophora gregata TaxID=51156 RepID=UPI0026DC4861|nr:uncharacterized protein ONS95_003667 [Cadophora gregata]KAK0106952.1 hypothetical protein ONS95_003667 [Cadophora gregata]